MLLLALAIASSLGQPAMGTYARHPSSTSFRPCAGALGETYSHLARLSGSFGYSADVFLACTVGEHAPWILVAGLACRSNEEKTCASTGELETFTSFQDSLQPDRDIRYRLEKYSVGENCDVDHDAGGVWVCKSWSSRQDARGVTLTTSGGDMILDDDWSVNDKTDVRDEDYIMRLGNAPDELSP